MICNICNSNKTYIKLHKHVFTRNNKTIEFESERRFCSNCDSLIYDKKLDDIVSKKAIKLYNQKYGIGEDIINIRKELGLSQEDFSKIIGCAKKTLISYEKGESIPNDTYMIVIKTIIDNPETIKLFISSNLDRYNAKEINKIDNKIDKYFSNNMNYLFNIKDEEPSEFNGYTKVSFDKMLNIITYLAIDGINKTKLLKEMFYIDFISYKNYGCSITGLEYSKLPHGPVIDDFEKIFENLYLNNLIIYEKKYKGDYEEHIIKSNLVFNKLLFRKEELIILDKIKNKFEKFKSREIEEYSHKEKGFIETDLGKHISYEYAFDINLNI